MVVVVVAVVAGVPFPLRHPLPFPHPLALLCQSEISIHSPTSTFFPIRSSPRFQSAIQSLLPPPPPSPDPLLPCVFNLRFQSFLHPPPTSPDSLLPCAFRSSPLCDFNPHPPSTPFSPSPRPLRFQSAISIPPSSSTSLHITSSHAFLMFNLRFQPTILPLRLPLPTPCPHAFSICDVNHALSPPRHSPNYLNPFSVNPRF